MSQFLSSEAAALAPYTPGEQPQDQQYIKLNTNESPFQPSPKVLEAVNQAEVSKLNLYSDPTCKELVSAVANHFGLKNENIITGNGSDEILSFAFRAFCGQGRGVAYADITYGFYQVWAAFYGLKATVIPLREDFTLSVDDYMDFDGTIFIANPNAPTGMMISVDEIKRLLEADPNRVVVIDEAYVDFGGESCVPLIDQYENLLVVQTMSKSRALAGGRVGFGIGCTKLIEDLNRIKYSFNPYNINRLSILAGAAAVSDEAYFAQCCKAVQENRSWTTAELVKRGFTVLPSKANFIFAKSDLLPGSELYPKLKQRGILVRWFNADRICDFVRITIGSKEQMQALISEIDVLLKEV